jgi:endonuclease-3
MSTFTLHKKAERVHLLLLETYGNPDWRPQYEPMNELILTLLSANTSDVNSGRAFQRLKETYPDWEAVMNAPLNELIEVIRPGGLAPTKAPRIQAALHRILQERGEFDISFLGELPVDEGLQWLTQFEGVGHKTASIVLLFCFNLPAFPVDTHVKRVSRRLGFAPDKASAEKIKVIWEELVPGEWFYPLHLNLIRHGRQVCTARNPHCAACSLREVCDWYASQS